MREITPPGVTDQTFAPDSRSIASHLCIRNALEEQSRPVRLTTATMDWNPSKSTGLPAPG